MRTKVLEFPKSRKKPELIEEIINKLFSKYDLFYAHQIEHSNGKIIITLILKKNDPKNKSRFKVKVFRKNKVKETEACINEFTSNKDVKVKFFTQSIARNTITSLVFHEVLKKVKASTTTTADPDKTKTKNPPKGSEQNKTTTQQ